MRIVFKILAAPFVVALTILGAVFSFILFLSAWIFYAAAFVFGLLGIAGMVQGDVSGGIGVVVIAFAIFILPSITEWIADRLDELKDSLKLFITT